MTTLTLHFSNQQEALLKRGLTHLLVRNLLGPVLINGAAATVISVDVDHVDKFVNFLLVAVVVHFVAQIDRVLDQLLKVVFVLQDLVVARVHVRGVREGLVRWAPRLGLEMLVESEDDL